MWGSRTAAPDKAADCDHQIVRIEGVNGHRATYPCMHCGREYSLMSILDTLWRSKIGVSNSLRVYSTKPKEDVSDE
jgi:hypothetical protein